MRGGGRNVAGHAALSGQLPREPVVSKRSGHLFEKSLLLKYLQSNNGQCPITGQELNPDEDLLAISADKTAQPRPAKATSVPGLLTLMQQEWDDAMLESFTLKQHLDATRQELSQALYQCDAACRVIARITRERDEAREQLQSQRAALARTAIAGGAPATQTTSPDQQQSSAMEVDGTADNKRQESQSLPEEVMSKLTTKWKELSKQRKKRAIPEGLTTKQAIGGWSEDKDFATTLHKTNPAGITCMALSNDGGFVATGGADKSAIVLDLSNRQQVHELTGHTKKVLDVCFGENSGTVLTASADSTARVWVDGKEAHVLSGCHKGSVTAVSKHPLNPYFATAGADASWAFCDMDRGDKLQVSSGIEEDKGYTCARWHPDGLIFATGTTDGKVRVWDIKTGTVAASFSDHAGAVNCIAFSENGYHMLSGGADQTARVWDLRKLKQVAMFDSKDPVTSVAFDASGTYMAVGSSDVKVHVVKEWSELSSLSLHKKKGATGVAFGPSASFLLASSMDRTLYKYTTVKTD